MSHALLTFIACQVIDVNCEDVTNYISVHILTINYLLISKHISSTMALYTKAYQD